jgi:hypothetical protein
MSFLCLGGYDESAGQENRFGSNPGNFDDSSVGKSAGNREEKSHRM